MKSYGEIQGEVERLKVEVATIQAELKTCNGEKYRGCWLDQTSDRTGQRIYTRLRWFKNSSTKLKGCRTLKPSEVGEAKRAIALWTKLEQIQQQQRQAETDLAHAVELIQKLGLEVQR
ncbi:hypothetical protein ACQ4M4_25805 [Leptolyngbya sp. AN02str]|uniref:hypothetical protein n=1 Tax=Leptolyngbya sp. AN02str TaxID=3423363 RepID=UPI003D31BA31